jgi:hypothetical protein
MQGYLVSHPLPADKVEEMLLSKGYAKPVNAILKEPEQSRAKVIMTGLNRPR